ncbi:MAG: hypothetical protein ACRECO_07315 [Xanthobacteraceae bacterium]
MNNFLGTWRQCRRPICKRARACRDKGIACSTERTRLTQRQSARAAASLHRALQRALAKRPVDDADAADAPPPARRRR